MPTLQDVLRKISISRSKPDIKSIRIDTAFYRHTELVGYYDFKVIIDVLKKYEDRLSLSMRYIDFNSMFGTDDYDSRKIMYICLMMRSKNGSSIFSHSTNHEITVIKSINSIRNCIHYESIV